MVCFVGLHCRRLRPRCSGAPGPRRRLIRELDVEGCVAGAGRSRELRGRRDRHDRRRDVVGLREAVRADRVGRGVRHRVRSRHVDGQAPASADREVIADL